MGDRAQLEITDGEHSVFFYSHWGGTGLADTLKRGLTVGRSLDDDEIYCIGSILREMVRDSGGMDQQIGLGVAFKFDLQDDERGAPLVLDVKAKTVRFKDGIVSVDHFVQSDNPKHLVGWS